MVERIWFTAPRPPQVEHVEIEFASLAPDPLQVEQVLCFLTFTFFLTPVAISSSVKLTFMRKFLPLSPLVLERPPPPPKKDENGSPPPPPKISPK